MDVDSNNEDVDDTKEERSDFEEGVYETLKDDEEKQESDDSDKDEESGVSLMLILLIILLLILKLIILHNYCIFLSRFLIIYL